MSDKYRRDPDLAESIIDALRRDLRDAEKQIEHLTFALERIRDCDWVITLPDRMDAVRTIAREALQ